MDKERYKSLCIGDSDKLTEEEIRQGWIFCCELDYALVNKNDKHIKSICLCSNNK